MPLYAQLMPLCYLWSVDVRRRFADDTADLGAAWFGGSTAKEDTDAQNIQNNMLQITSGNSLN